MVLLQIFVFAIAMIIFWVISGGDYKRYDEVVYNIVTKDTRALIASIDTKKKEIIIKDGFDIASTSENVVVIDETHKKYMGVK